jgi:ATP-dependent helicase/DNAse subunit B
MPDKFKATWVSHSSISDFLECPRLYYLRNVYKDPQTGHKVNIVSPHMSLGIAVHNVLEGLAELKSEERANVDLDKKFEEEWEKVCGKQGGFIDKETEGQFKERGKNMIQRAKDNFGIFEDKIVKIKEDLPWFWLSEEDEIILCGKVDWIRYIESDDSVHIIDFKTGKHKEKEGSLQLPIYTLIMKNCQKRETSGIFYWYLDVEDNLTEMPVPEIEDSYKKILEIARQIKDIRERRDFKCPHGGCRACSDFEKIINGEAEFVGVGTYRQDLYLIKEEKSK